MSRRRCLNLECFFHSVHFHYDAFLIDFVFYSGDFFYFYVLTLFFYLFDFLEIETFALLRLTVVQLGNSRILDLLKHYFVK